MKLHQNQIENKDDHGEDTHENTQVVVLGSEERLGSCNDKHITVSDPT